MHASALARAHTHTQAQARTHSLAGRVCLSQAQAVQRRQERARLVYSALVVRGAAELPELVGSCLAVVNALDPEAPRAGTRLAFDDGGKVGRKELTSIVERALSDLLRLGLVQKGDGNKVLWAAVDPERAREKLSACLLGTCSRM